MEIDYRICDHYTNPVNGNYMRWRREPHGEEPVLRAIGIILCVMGAALLVLAHLCSRYPPPGAADQLLLPPPPWSTRSFITPRTARP